MTPCSGDVASPVRAEAISSTSSMNTTACSRRLISWNTFRSAPARPWGSEARRDGKTSTKGQSRLRPQPWRMWSFLCRGGRTGPRNAAASRPGTWRVPCAPAAGSGAVRSGPFHAACRPARPTARGGGAGRPVGSAAPSLVAAGGWSARSSAGPPQPGIHCCGRRGPGFRGWQERRDPPYALACEPVLPCPPAGLPSPVPATQSRASKIIQARPSSISGRRPHNFSFLAATTATPLEQASMISERL